MMREKFKYLLIGQLFTAAVGSALVPVQCLKCSIIGETLPASCQSCHNITYITDTEYANTSPSCKKDFAVSINSTGFDAEEGDDIILTCVHNHTDMMLTYGWKQNGEIIKENQNKSELRLEKVYSSDEGQYICYVTSACGTYESPPQRVTVKNFTAVILVVCAIAAITLVLAFSVAMKLKLKRDNADHKERMKQRAQGGSSGSP